MLFAPLLVVGLFPSTAGPAEAAGTEVRVFPAVKYVAESSPTFSVDIRAESVATPPMHVIYDESNVDTDLALGTTPEVRASYDETNVDTDLAIGNEQASEGRAQGFRVTEAGPVNRVLLWVRNVGAPIDGLRVEVRADDGGLPDTSPGGLLSESRVASGDDIATDYGWVAFELLSPPVLSPGTQYHLVVKRTWVLDAANYYEWGADTSSPGYADGAAGVYDGLPMTWAVTSPAADHAFVVDTTPTGRAQGFRVLADSPVNRVLLWLKRVGPLTADDGFLTVEIRGDSGGVPGDVLATSTSQQLYGCEWVGDPPVWVCVDVLGTTYDWVVFDTWTGPPAQLSPGTQYHLALKWSDKPEGTTSYITWGADTSSPGSADGAAMAHYGGSTWLGNTPEADHAFEVAYACVVDPAEPLVTGPCGLGGFEIEIVFDTSDFQYDYPGGIQEGPFLTSTGRSVFGCSESYDTSDPLNAIVSYSCNTTGGTPLGPEGSGVLATVTFTASCPVVGALDLGNTVLLDITNTPLPHSSQGNTVRCEDLGTEDTDGDGCTDIEEAGDDPIFGGHRNPHDPYDFYDVPVPPREDAIGDGYGDDLPPIGPNGPTNEVVDMTDVVAVLFYVFAEDGMPPNGNGVDYDSLKDGDWNGPTVVHPDGVVDSYDEVGLRYDRTLAVPFSGPPNGVIDMIDVITVLGQFPHDCSEPPP